MLPARFSSYLPTWTADVPTVEVEPPAGGQLASAAPAPEGSTFSLQTNEKADLARTLGIPADVLDAILKRKGH
jgi:hypothetical protein